MTREFLIQRYCRDNHPQVRGLRPFVSTGPRFMEWAIPGSLEKHREWRFRPDLYGILSSAFPLIEEKPPEDREAIAELLLRDGVVQALWSVDSPQCLPIDQRWQASITGVAAEIPYIVPGDPRRLYDLAYWTLEFLSSLSEPAYFREYVSPDCLTLEPCIVPLP